MSESIILDDPRQMAVCQSIWLELRERDWRRLALVAAGPNASTLDVARRLSQAASSFEGLEVRVIDGTGVSMAGCRAKLDEIASEAAASPRTIIAVDSPDTEHAAVALGRAADAALMLVTLETSTTAQVRKILAKLGEERFIGSVTMRITRGRGRRGLAGNSPPATEPSWRSRRSPEATGTDAKPATGGGKAASPNVDGGSGGAGA